MTQSLVIRDDMSLMELGNVLFKSGYFTDARDVAQAIVKVLAGREMGFGPIASMTGIHIVKGKPSMGANLIASAVKRSGRYDYRVKEHTDKICSIEYYERIDGKREMIGVSTFTLEDARKAGTQNLDKFPRNMLFARAMSNGAKWYCADVFGGPVYTPDELGATVDGETGEVIDNGTKWIEPIVMPSAPLPTDADGDAEVIAQAEAAGNEPTGEQAPERPYYRMAKVTFGEMTPDQWHARCERFAADNANWQRSDDPRKPDMNHILASAGHAGYQYINAENVEQMFNDIMRLHEAKAAA